MKCEICGTQFTPRLHGHYISRDDIQSGFVQVVSNKEETIYDTFDCPTCGCQIIAQPRRRRFVEAVEETENE